MESKLTDRNHRGALRAADREHLPLIIVIALSLILGIFVYNDFGQSWDEAVDVEYGEITLRAYSGSDDYLTARKIKNYYGPFYQMLTAFVLSISDKLFPAILQVDIRHFLNFLTFNAGAIALYSIGRRIFSRSVSLIVVMIYLTQPILFGHAFINQKDIPFMVFFLASIALGMKAADCEIGDLDPQKETRIPDQESMLVRLKNSFMRDWNAFDVKMRILFLSAHAMTLLILVELFITSGLILPGLETLLQAAYTGSSIPLIQNLFARYAQFSNEYPITGYLAKLRLAYSYATILFTVAALVFFLRYWKRAVPTFYRTASESLFPRNKVIFAAAAALGLTTAIRIAGPWAGVLVSLYYLQRARQRALLPLAWYWLVSAAVTYATWPFLWGAPIARFIESMTVMTKFSSHQALYGGVIYPSTNLPWHYALGLIGFQFTEPVVVFAILGLVLGAGEAMRKKKVPTAFLVYSLWFLIPILAVVFFRPPLYGNARQLLFLYPPLLIFSGVVVSRFWQGIRPGLLRYVFLAAILLPGLMGIISLHPYSYSYYNSFIGGAAGASGKFEFDPWCTSYREVMTSINDVAPTGSTVAVWGPVSAAAAFARDDLNVYGTSSGVGTPDFALGCKWALLNSGYFPEMDTVFRVGKLGNTFAIAKASQERGE